MVIDSVDESNPTTDSLSPVFEKGELKVVELKESDYKSNKGYDPGFLSKAVPLPTLGAELEDDKVMLNDGSGYELKYNHFSLVMSKKRRLAFFTAVNIDGSKLIKIDREDRWYLDPRISKEFQSGAELYRNNPLDRGHLVRRLDPVWGDVAQSANEDTFHFTNCAPQHSGLNQKTWADLEDYILNNTDNNDLQVSVFTGPVFRDDDMLYRERFQIPAEFWKVVVFSKDNTSLSATAYLQTQKNLIEGLKFAFGEYRTYQVPIAKIESLTKLNFGETRNYDPLANKKGPIVKIISNAEDILL
jgi:endonuclease G